MREDRPLDIMVVNPALDPELPLSLYDRLRAAMTIRSVPHGAPALRLIEAGAVPDIILVDPCAPGIDVAAMQRILALRADAARTRLSFIDDGYAVLHDIDAGEPIAAVRALGTLHEASDDDIAPSRISADPARGV